MNGAAVAVGTNVYLFGSVSSSTRKQAYKYDTLTDTYTNLFTLAYEYYRCPVAAVGTNIFIFGVGDTATATYKYDTTTNTPTKVCSVPYSISTSCAVAVGTNIYLFGGNGSLNSAYRKYAYKYDTLTDTYTKLTDIPYSFYYGGAVSAESSIYLFGGTSISGNTYKYDTLTDTYTQLTDIPYSFYNGSAVAIGDDEEVYLLGGQGYPTKVQILELNSADYEDNQVVVSQGVAKYHTKLLTNENNAEYWFNNAWIYTDEDGLVKGLPTYYGNGTSWVKFKN